MRKFEEILENDKNLNDLINHHEITMVTKFNKIDSYNNEFIDWLSPKYYLVFTTIFNKVIGTKEEFKMAQLLNSPLFCNQETKEKLIDFLLPHLEKSCISSSDELYAIQNYEIDFQGIENYSLRVYKSHLGYINKRIFENFDSNEISILKERIIDNSIKILDSLKTRIIEKNIKSNSFDKAIKQTDKIDLNPNQFEYVMRINAKKRKKTWVKWLRIIFYSIITIVVLIRLLIVLERLLN